MQGTSTTAKVSAGTVAEIESWIKVAKADGATEILYVIPPGTRLGPAATDAIEREGGRIVDSIPL